jgi:CO/xanthine dehydrogenase FAD-binding subunit
MRATAPTFDYYTPDTISDAVNLIGKLKPVNIIAGGTDFVPAVRLKGFRPKHVVSLVNLRKELSYVTFKGGAVRIGALTKIRDAQRSEHLRKNATCLHEALSQIGSVQIRNMATIGGNLCNASPAADSAPPLLVLDASVEIVRRGGRRTIPLKDFFLGPGKTVLRKGELLKEIAFRPEAGTVSSFQKLGRTRGEDISVAAAAVLLKTDGSRISHARIALGSVAPIPIRAYKSEKELLGKAASEAVLDSAAAKAAEEAEPITDVRATGDYRRSAVKALVRQGLARALERARGGA